LARARLRYIGDDKGENSMPVLRSRNDRLIAGVCGGFAKALGWNPTAVRILYVVASILSAAFPGILVYLVLWVVMPTE
jgi:phage shock protein C